MAHLPSRPVRASVKIPEQVPYGEMVRRRDRRRAVALREAAQKLGTRRTRHNVILLLSQWRCAILPVGNPINDMKEKADVLQGTLALMVLKTLDVLGSLHGYGIARRIEQISGDLLTVNQGTLYPVLLKLEQEGSIASEWGASENNRRARFYRLTRDGRKQLQAETRGWEQTAAIIGRFFAAKAEDFQ
jgi:PadR family transcriptional regulator PadR